jgi:hypothetical protein
VDLRRLPRPRERDHHCPPRQDRLPPRETGLGALADLGFTGLDDDPENPRDDHRPPSGRGRPLTPLRRKRTSRSAANEYGFADLKNWHVLAKVRMNAKHASTLLRALLVLANVEISG